MNALFEELYLEYEMKYRDSMKKEVEKKVRESRDEIARAMLAKGATVEFVSDVAKISREDLLRMKAELDEKRPDGSS